MKFQLPVKGCFLQRCHEINDERKKRERDGGRKSAAQTTQRKYPVRCDGVPFSGARLVLIWLKFSLIILIAFFHTHRSLLRQIGRYCALRGHAETFTVPVRSAPARRRFAPLPGLSLCSACAWDKSISFYVTVGRKNEKKREFARLSSSFPEIDIPLAQLAAVFWLRNSWYLSWRL